MGLAQNLFSVTVSIKFNISCLLNSSSIVGLFRFTSSQTKDCSHVSNPLAVILCHSNASNTQELLFYCSRAAKTQIALSVSAHRRLHGPGIARVTFFLLILLIFHNGDARLHLSGGTNILTLSPKSNIYEKTRTALKLMGRVGSFCYF